MTTEQDTGQQTNPNRYNLNKVYCSISGVKFYLADNLGFQYLIESSKVHPAFLDTNTLRTMLKYESNKKLKPEALITLDWQDINLGIESDFDLPKADQILAKSFIVGVILAQMNNLELSYSRLCGRQMHSLNISLCKHRRRAQLLWWARRLCNWSRKDEVAKINLDTVWESSEGAAYQTKIRSDAMGSYLSAIIEDDDSRLPRLRGKNQASVTVYDQKVASRSRQRRAEKPLNGQHVDWGIDKAIMCIKTLKAAKVITKKQHTSMEMCLTNWADYPVATRERLGQKLIELSACHQLKQDYSMVLERIGYGFVTGEIAEIASTSNYTINRTFLGEVINNPTKEKKPSLKLKLRGLA